ncbi:MAG: glycine cleavage system protein GcvH [Chloroflexota bacterium]|nr:glycine cleavage system protein GcvH [Chloroflexota bacterium]
MELDSKARYAGTHEWARRDDDEIICGISDHAQEFLSDIVYVELPEVGDVFDKGDPFGVVESVKAASDVYMPMTGEITAVNEALEEEPELINSDPYGEGWLIRFAPSDPTELDNLMDADDYGAFIAEEEG